MNDIKFKGNPILEPILSHDWESRCVFNPAIIYLDDKVHIFYRAVGKDMISRLGYASSKDGYHINERLPYPVFKPATNYEKGGCEDPRLTEIDGKYVMTYTAYGDIFQIGITSISKENILKKNWTWGERIFPFPEIKNKNAVIFPRKINNQYVMLHRIDPTIYIAYSHDLKKWKDIKPIMYPRITSWDCLKIGATGPPIEIEDGWLLIYHGVDELKTYRLGFVILDKDNPEKIIYRCEKPILEPKEDYEKFGNVPNVIFSCGSILFKEKLLIYYGAADKVIGVATFPQSLYSRSFL